MIIPLENDIVLKEINLSDAEDIFHTIHTQRTYLGRWLPFVEYTQVVDDTLLFIKSILEASPENRELVFTIREKNEFVGLIGFKDTDRQNHKTEIGYWLSEYHQKKGIITKSVLKLCELAFNELGINRIQIRCAVENISSKNIPKRIGFQLEGIERQGELLSSGEFTDLEVYSLLKAEFYLR